MNGKYYDRNTDEEYIRWLKAFRRLGEEGLLKSDIFVDKRSQLEEKILDGRYFCLLYQRSDVEWQQNIIEQNNPEWIYIAMDGPKNSQMDDPVLPLSGINGWTLTYVSKNCQCPEKIIQLISFLLSEEGQQLIQDKGRMSIGCYLINLKKVTQLILWNRWRTGRNRIPVIWDNMN